MKTCTHCLLPKPFDEFSKSNSTKDGRQSWCKLCKAEWEETHKAANKLRHAEYYQEHRDAIKQQTKEYAQENKDAINAWRRNYDKTRRAQRGPKVRKPRTPKPLAERFWKKVDKNTCLGDICGCHKGLGCCWVWTASKHKFGYGYIRDKGHTYLAHRVSYALMNNLDIEAVPGDLYVLHACDVPQCVRHLFPGDAKENALDAKQKGRPLGRPSPFSKEQRLLITTLCKTMRNVDIATQLGISPGYVAHLRHRERLL